MAIKTVSAGTTPTDEGTTGPRIVVVGGGYAGLLAAQRVAGRTRRQGARVTLVDQSPTFVERIRLHQLATARALPQRSFTTLLAGTGARFVQGRVTTLAPDERAVVVQTAAGARRLAYDYLIYALGSTAERDRVPGVRAHALAIGSPDGAAALRERLPAAAARGGQVVVCGGGLTGIETAAELAETYPTLRVRLVTRGAVGAGLSERGRAHVRQTLARLGVVLDEAAGVAKVGPVVVTLDDGRTLPYDLCVWAGAFSVPPLAREAGLAVNGQGQVRTDAMLRSLSHPTVYAVGDAAAPELPDGPPIRMACATAMPMAAQAAENITATLAGQAPTPFRFAYALQCISLGRRDGLIQFVDADDQPGKRIVTGRLATWVKEAICQATVLALRLERRWPGGYGPPTLGRFRRTAAARRRPGAAESSRAAAG